MNWKWHYHAILNIFFFVLFGFNSAQALRTGTWISFVMWTLFTFCFAFWLVIDWQKDWSLEVKEKEEEMK